MYRIDPVYETVCVWALGFRGLTKSQVRTLRCIHVVVYDHIYGQFNQSVEAEKEHSVRLEYVNLTHIFTCSGCT